MSLRDAVEAAGALSAAQIVTWLGETVDGTPDSTLRGYGWVSKNFGGPAVAEAIKSAMESAGLSGAAIMYCSVGIDLSLAETQSQLTTMAGAIPELASVLNGIKAIGRPVLNRWALFGLSSLPAESEVQAELDRIADQQAKTSLMNDIVNPWFADSSKTVADLKAQLGV